MVVCHQDHQDMRVCEHPASLSAARPISSSFEAEILSFVAVFDHDSNLIRDDISVKTDVSKKVDTFHILSGKHLQSQHLSVTAKYISKTTLYKYISKNPALQRGSDLL